MQIQNNATLASGFEITPRNSTSSEASASATMFDEILGDVSRTKGNQVTTAADVKDFLPFGDSTLLGLPIRGDGLYTRDEAAAWEPFADPYLSLLPKLGGARVKPPVDNYDLGLEILRLARVELKADAMEAAGEFDKAVDAYIGLHGLKDRITGEERAVLKERIIEISKAVMLQDEWAKAYIGYMAKRIDVSIEGLRSYLTSESGKPKMKPVNEEMPASDPNVLGFLTAPRWEQFEVSPAKIHQRAKRMMLEAG